MLSIENKKRILNSFKILQQHRHYFVSLVDDDLTKWKVGFIGPKDSAYECSLFVFSIDFNNNYPINPPLIKFITPMTNKCRMHPNLYACGKVCLNILNTWDSKMWNSKMTIEEILIVIQSLLDNNPISYEPGQENKNCHKYFMVARYLSLLDGYFNVLNGSNKRIPETIINDYKKFINNKHRLERINTIIDSFNFSDKQIIRWFHGNLEIDLIPIKFYTNILLYKIEEENKKPKEIPKIENNETELWECDWD